MKKLWLSIALATAVLLLFAITTTQAQSGVGTLSYVQQNGRRVEGLVAVGGYSVTVTLKDPGGTVKS
ncbi:MAG: hypothetical protein JXR84_09305, partial [Anaerolineae bacterium]|nr:hypothetical protein [Anaerolineae bacterium]